MKKILTLSRFELKKLFIKKSLMVIIAFMCLFNIINIVRHYNIYADGGFNDGMFNRAKYTVLKLYGGELTEEKLKEFVGHTPLQVLMGAILGILIGWLMG